MLGITIDTNTKTDTQLNHKNYSQIPELNDNPFIETLVVNTKVKLSRFKKDETINNQEETLDLQKQKELEEEQKRLKDLGVEIGKVVVRKKTSFVFLFTAPIMNYNELSYVAFKILFYIFDEKIHFNQDYIIISIKECCIKFDCTLPTVCKAFLELTNNKILSKKLDNVWWINPNYFYVGDREKIFKNVEKR